MQTALGFMAGFAAAEMARELRAPRADGSVRRPSERLTPAAKDAVAALEPGRGRQARDPGEIPARGWADIVVRTYREFSADQAPMIAAGVTFFTLLALFPAVGAFVALYGLFADVSEAQRHVQAMSAILPGGAISLIGDQMVRAAAAHESGLSLAFVAGLGVAIWSANGAMKAIVTGLNIAYEETETRGLIGKIAVPLVFTLGALLFALVAVGFAALGGVVSDQFGREARWLYNAVYWPILFVAFALGLALLYRYGPSRRAARWRWVTWGSAAAAVVWLAVSVGFSFYAAHFGSYDRTYGPLGAVIGFMTWTWISSMVVLMGAELNSEIEHQTARDTTVGADKPMGARGAEMADTVGAAVGAGGTVEAGGRVGAMSARLARRLQLRHKPRMSI